MKEYHDAAPRDRAEVEASRVSFEAPAMIVESIEVEGGEA
jgi:hypothetical protein